MLSIASKVIFNGYCFVLCSCHLESVSTTVFLFPSGPSNGTAVGGESSTHGFFYNITNTGTVTQCSPHPLTSTAIPTVLPSIASLNGPANSSMPYTPQGVVPTPQGVVPAPPLPPAPGQLPPGYHQLLPMPVMTLPSQALNEGTPLYSSFQTVEH